MSFLSRARHIARQIGLEVQRANPMTVWYRRLPALLEKSGIDVVCDVGANDGGFASELLENGFTGDIFSFEALPNAWAALKRRADGHASGRWHVTPLGAVGEIAGEAEFFEAGNSVSSSLLPMTDEHKLAAPGSAPIGAIKVPIRTLDECIEMLEIDRPFYLKIDVQGAEHMVLEGARKALANQIKGVQLEMGLATLYDGQKSARELDEMLRCNGFKLWDIIPGFRDPSTLRLLQYDGIYLRS